MKAVHKFKKLLDGKRPPVMASILDEDYEGASHLTQTPINMTFDESTSPRFNEKSHSVDAHDRRPLQSALASEGVHQKLESVLPVRGGRHSTDRNLGPATGTAAGESRAMSEKDDPFPGRSHPILMKSETIDLSSASRGIDDDEEPHDHVLFPFPRTASPPLEMIRRTQTLDESRQKGHAHDPLEDHLYLYVGPSTFSGESDAQGHDTSFNPEEDFFVSESPGAADIDIYETAYRDEIEKIRARLQEEGKEGEESEPVIYLNRRVDARLVAIGGFAGRMMAYGEEGIERIKEFKGLREGRARVTGVSRALRAAAVEEYGRRKQERRARDTAETARAEYDKSKAAEAGASNEKRGEPPGDDAGKSGQQTASQGSQNSIFATMTPLAGKAWEKGHQAKSSFKELYGRAWKQRASDGTGS